MERELTFLLTESKAMFADHDIFAVNGEGETLLHAIAGREETFQCQKDALELFKRLMEMGLDLVPPIRQYEPFINGSLPLMNVPPIG